MVASVDTPIDDFQLPLLTPEEIVERSWLPHKPLCGDTKDSGMRHRTRPQALKRRYIEANPLCLKSLIVTDVDTHDVANLANEVGLPNPTWVCGTMCAGGIMTGHIVFALHDPVCLTDAARRAPVNLLARIETGITTVLGGDIGYGGRITKNPLWTQHGVQTTLWGDSDGPQYGLRDLSRALEAIEALPGWNDPRPRKNSGVGRNVDVFDRTRRWAYRAIKGYWDDSGGITTWGEVVEAFATMKNLALEAEGRTPLPEREIYHLARSITKWTWRHFTPNTAHAWHARKGTAGGRASGVVRRKQARLAIQEA